MDGEVIDRPETIHIHITSADLAEKIKKVDDFLFGDPMVIIKSLIANCAGRYSAEEYILAATYKKFSNLTIEITNFGSVRQNKDRGGAFFNYFINSDIFTPASEELIKEYGLNTLNIRNQLRKNLKNYVKRLESVKE